jgi:ribonuclease Z
MASKIKITFLGTSGAIPTSQRNHTSILLTCNEENILIDCGEGTQRQFRKARLNPCKLTRLLITHWHGDHVLGIPGLLQTLAFSGYNKTLFIYGPQGTKKFMKNLLNTFLFKGNLSFEVKEVNGKFFETNDFSLEAESVPHGVPCNAYTFIRKGKRRIDKKKLKKSKLPQGPMLKKLNEGKDVVYQGKKYSVNNLTFKEGDKKISFVFDTSFEKKLISLVKNSDLLICESTFDSSMEDLAKEYFHLTSIQAARIAKESKSRKLILTHLSQRNGPDYSKILKEAKSVFRNSFIANDLDKVEV